MFAAAEYDGCDKHPNMSIDLQEPRIVTNKSEDRDRNNQKATNPPKRQQNHQTANTNEETTYINHVGPSNLHKKTYGIPDYT